MNAAMLLLVAGTMATPQPATTNATASPSFGIGRNVTFDQSGRPPGAPQSPTHQAGGKSVMVVAQGSIVFCCDTTGFTLGVGVGFIPMSGYRKFEIGADINFIHFGGNGVYVSFNGQYDFRLAHSKVVPFLGGGLGIAHQGNGTNAGLQLLGGIQTTLHSGRAIRFSLRLLFAGGRTTTFVMGGFAF
jgi:hypothetical protein